MVQQKELLEYIASSKQAGANNEQIRQALMQVGHQPAVIEQAIFEIDNPVKLNASQIRQLSPDSTSYPFVRIFLLINTIFLVINIAFLVVLGAVFGTIAISDTFALFTTLLTVLIVAVSALLLYFMYKGHFWALIVYTIIAALYTPSMVKLILNLGSVADLSLNDSLAYLRIAVFLLIPAIWVKELSYFRRNG